ncbi:MAG: hypothetical protein C5B59_00135 [Bacteroidetes bacterium]|nr:MAG: hypothetical protein C5B59_00135 [Bacteroidota bacterium]
MKTINLFRTGLLTACVAMVFACNKSSMNNAGNGTTSSDDMQVQADDQAQISSEDEAITNDVNTALYNQVSTAGTGGATVETGTTTVMGTEVNGLTGPIHGLICDATVVVNDTSNPKTITITYDGTNCRGNRTRVGVIVISMPAGEHWSDAGATVTISIQNLKITRIRDNKSITLNGTKTITNVTGGLLTHLSSLGTITHTINGSLSITFDSGKQRSWSVSKQRVFTYDNGIVITTTGTHTDSLGNSNVAEWGTNRSGVQFESLISAPKVIRQDCDFRLTSGQNTIVRSDNFTSVITYGLDANGDPTSCPGTGTYYFKVVVTTPGGLVYTKILPY